MATRGERVRTLYRRALRAARLLRVPQARSKTLFNVQQAFRFGRRHDDLADSFLDDGERAVRVLECVVRQPPSVQSLFFRKTDAAWFEGADGASAAAPSARKADSASR